jgi:hypothetical protein
MENIERFDAYAVYIFGSLYDAFPKPTRLDPAAIVKAVGLSGDRSEEAVIAQGTIDWLRETGFLIYRDPSDTRHTMEYQYVLAPKAFAALRRDLPDAVKGGSEKGKPETLGEKAKAFSLGVAKNMAMEGGKKLASELVTLGINWFAS